MFLNQTLPLKSSGVVGIPWVSKPRGSIESTPKRHFRTLSTGNNTSLMLTSSSPISEKKNILNNSFAHGCKNNHFSILDVTCIDQINESIISENSIKLDCDLSLSEETSLMDTSLATENSILDTRSQALKEKICKLTTNVDELTEENQRLKDDVADFKHAMEFICKKYRNLEKEHERDIIASLKLDYYRQELQHANEDISCLRRQNMDLREKLHKAVRFVREETQTSENRVKDMMNTIESLTLQNGHLRKLLDISAELSNPQIQEIEQALKGEERKIQQAESVRQEHLERIGIHSRSNSYSFDAGQKRITNCYVSPYRQVQTLVTKSPDTDPTLADTPILNLKKRSPTTNLLSDTPSSSSSNQKRNSQPTLGSSKSKKDLHKMDAPRTTTTTSSNSIVEKLRRESTNDTKSSHKNSRKIRHQRSLSLTNFLENGSFKMFPNASGSDLRVKSSTADFSFSEPAEEGSGEKRSSSTLGQFSSSKSEGGHSSLVGLSGSNEDDQLVSTTENIINSLKSKIRMRRQRGNSHSMNGRISSSSNPLRHSSDFDRTAKNPLNSTMKLSDSAESDQLNGNSEDSISTILASSQQNSEGKKNVIIEDLNECIDE